MADSSKTKFSSNVVAIAGLITAVGGLITILVNAGYIGNKKKDTKKEKDEVKQEIIVKLPEETIKPKKEVIIKKIIPEEKVKTYNLTGYWKDSNNPNGRYYLNHESTGKISFTEYSNLYGQWTVSAQGVGVISGRKLNLPYTTYLGSTGHFEGELSENGKSISGKINDHVSGAEIMMVIAKE